MVVQIIETTSLGYTEHRKGLETDASGPVHVFGSVFKIGAILKIGDPFVNKKKMGVGGKPARRIAASFFDSLGCFHLWGWYN
jgi:hypothetical protein